MIHYALRCANEHEFDGWFRDSARFDQEAASGRLDCPVCASTSVQRALMAPRITGQAKAPPSPVTDAPNPARQAVAAPGSPAPAETVLPADVKPPGERAPGWVQPRPAMPDGLRAALQRIRAEVEKTCDYVGPQFAQVVRRMAEDGGDAKPVYGEATAEEAAALAEDGIEVARLPWVPRADS